MKYLLTAFFLITFWAASAEEVAPKVFLIDPQALMNARAAVQAGDSAVMPALKQLLKQADKALKSGPFSVVDKEVLPPSGDKHDYMSVGPYWWPNPDTENGLPYVRRDGEVNPDRHKYDNVAMGKMNSAVQALSLAYYLTGNETYAQHAAKLLRAWFIDPATRMNPNLRYGQAVPGKCDGRCIGIIDTSGLPHLIDSIGMLKRSAAWTEDDQQAAVKWFGEYGQWLRTSEIGKDEARQKNNHGTWYDVQVASFALFCGDTATAREVLSVSVPKRLKSHIEPDGRQPHELARTLSFNYSTMNLKGFFCLAELGDDVGVDLWNWRSEDGRSMQKALDYIVEGAKDKSKWNYKQIKPIDPSALNAMLIRASIHYDKGYLEVMQDLCGDKWRTERDALLILGSKQ